MKFRQNGFLFIEGLIAYSVSLLISCCLMIYDAMFFRILLIPTLIILILLITLPHFHNEYIIIDNDGIVCHKANKVMWKFKWSDIKEMKQGTRSRYKSLEIILKEYDCKSTPNISYIENTLYFQYGKKAKQAVKQYCPCPII